MPNSERGVLQAQDLDRCPQIHPLRWPGSRPPHLLLRHLQGEMMFIYCSTAIMIDRKVLFWIILISHQQRNGKENKIEE